MTKDIEPGDMVKIVSQDGEECEGMLVPRPEMLDSDITVIKLSSGYNRGFAKESIKEIMLVKKKEKKEVKAKPVKHNPKLPTVAMISLGGTIASKVDYHSGGVSAEYTADDYVAMCPELLGIANIKAVKVLEVMSEDMHSEHWITAAKAIAKELDSVDGVVVTQGTDTLHFTTAAMTFMLKDLGKPVIFTAAQRSIDRGSSDAFFNLICSVRAAVSDMSGVYTCMHGTSNDDYCSLIRGNKVRKMHTSRRDAFRPINDKEVGRVTLDSIELFSACARVESSVKVKATFEKKVALVQIYPGMDPGVIDYYLDNGYKGIVLSCTALGHVPTVFEEYSFMDVLEKAQKKKIPIVIATQTLYGAVHPYVYTNLRKLSLLRSCIFAHDMLPEVAYIKLGWVLGQTDDFETVVSMMQENVAGEMNAHHTHDMFLN